MAAALGTGAGAGAGGTWAARGAGRGARGGWDRGGCPARGRSPAPRFGQGLAAALAGSGALRGRVHSPASAGARLLAFGARFCGGARGGTGSSPGAARRVPPPAWQAPGLQPQVWSLWRSLIVSAEAECSAGWSSAARRKGRWERWCGGPLAGEERQRDRGGRCSRLLGRWEPTLVCIGLFVTPAGERSADPARAPRPRSQSFVWPHGESWSPDAERRPRIGKRKQLQNTHYQCVLYDDFDQFDKPGAERSWRRRAADEDWDSELEDDLLGEDLLSGKKNQSDLSDEELNDDLLQSDNEDEENFRMEQSACFQASALQPDRSPPASPEPPGRTQHASLAGRVRGGRCCSAGPAGTRGSVCVSRVPLSVLSSSSQGVTISLNTTSGMVTSFELSDNTNDQSGEQESEYEQGEDDLVYPKSDGSELYAQEYPEEGQYEGHDAELPEDHIAYEGEPEEGPLYNDEVLDIEINEPLDEFTPETWASLGSPVMLLLLVALGGGMETLELQKDVKEESDEEDDDDEESGRFLTHLPSFQTELSAEAKAALLEFEERERQHKQGRYGARRGGRRGGALLGRGAGDQRRDHGERGRVQAHRPALLPTQPSVVVTSLSHSARGRPLRAPGRSSGRRQGWLRRGRPARVRLLGPRAVGCFYGAFQRVLGLGAAISLLAPDKAYSGQARGSGHRVPTRVLSGPTHSPRLVPPPQPQPPPPPPPQPPQQPPPQPPQQQPIRSLFQQQPLQPLLPLQHPHHPSPPQGMHMPPQVETPRVMMTPPPGTPQQPKNIHINPHFKGAVVTPVQVEAVSRDGGVAGAGLVGLLLELPVLLPRGPQLRVRTGTGTPFILGTGFSFTVASCESESLHCHAGQVALTKPHLRRRVRPHLSAVLQLWDTHAHGASAGVRVDRAVCD
ncbi:RNA-binding protein 33 [Galemys pyrenaicus]|uniref:RNA-binding protein 33 n=1 Tax=Galemys pyrenaicus TaxID=202257 RepID=A0A8J6DDS6_GALPY|nr:RNA-binding protein 33 [Galemys pyrenaicus]